MTVSLQALLGWVVTCKSIIWNNLCPVGILAIAMVTIMTDGARSTGQSWFVMLAVTVLWPYLDGVVITELLIRLLKVPIFLEKISVEMLLYIREDSTKYANVYLIFVIAFSYLYSAFELIFCLFYVWLKKKNRIHRISLPTLPMLHLPFNIFECSWWCSIPTMTYACQEDSIHNTWIILAHIWP